MIVSKPKARALFAIGFFILICFGLGGYNVLLILNGSSAIFNYVMAVLFLLPAILLFLRQLFNFKIISIGNDKLQVWYPLRFRTLRGNFKDINYWQETIIKTRTGVFKQLDIVFPSRTIKLSIQENTNYIAAVNYFSKKLKNKRKQ